MGRVEELRKQALTDYEREVSQHAAKLEEMRVMRAKVAETEERSRQAVAAAEEARKATAREAVCAACSFSMSLILAQGVVAGRVGKSQGEVQERVDGERERTRKWGLEREWERSDREASRDVSQSRLFLT